MDRRLMFMENFWPLGVVCPCPGAIYMYISIIFIHLHLTKLHVEHPWEGGKKVYINGQGHMTKMAAMAINRKKTLKIFFSGVILKLGVNGALQRLYKWPWGDLDLVDIGFSRNFCSLWPENWKTHTVYSINNYVSIRGQVYFLP